MFHEGHQIGPYTLIRRLGRGGFGDVWLAERRSQFLTKKVAVKLPHDDQVDFNTIQREAGLWEEASGHPNVLPIIDAEVYDGQVVIVSEFADGGSLADRLTDLGTTSVKEAVDLTMGILTGLEFLHGKRIIHRDIKPQNILLQGNTPRLADFGISRAMATSGVSSTIIGTDAYMSPEAFDGKRTVQTDIWSTGVVLYQLLNGTLPFPQTHPTERMFAVLTKDFEPLSGDVPSDLKKIVATALAKLPENRFASAAAMREALAQAKVRIDHPTLANTEVFDRSQIPIFAPQSADADPEATVIRVQIPNEQETLVRPAGPEAPASTQLAYPTGSVDTLTSPEALSGDTKQSQWNMYEPPPNSLEVLTNAKKALADNPLAGIIGMGILIVGGFFLLLALYAAVPNKASNNSTRLNINNTLSSNSSNRGSNTANKAANTANTYSSNSNSFPSNTMMSNSNADYRSDLGRPAFCRGYTDGWTSAYKDTIGRPPSSGPVCPDEKDYKDKSYEGGRTTGYYQGLVFSRDYLKNTSKE
ncbi:MAG: serine/threonine protein kinase [Pyrinomonadaceae bacterium]|nr:serine/threonine protein kinase [Pyrinomonadaceae bacterium]